MATYFDLMKQYWVEYEAAMLAKPYDPDKVQGLGMRFAAEWNRMADYTAEHFPPPEGQKFDYSMHRQVMAELMKDGFGGPIFD